MFQTSASKLGASLGSLKFLKSRGLSDSDFSDDNESQDQAHVSDHDGHDSDFSESDSEHDVATTSTGSRDSGADPEPIANTSKQGHRSSKSDIKAAPQSHSGVGVSRFDPFSNNSSQEWSLNSGQDDYVRT